ncbi:MAG: hypothetical protein WD009_02905 [Phycisphaeraceae bacterium]
MTKLTVWTAVLCLACGGGCAVKGGAYQPDSDLYSDSLFYADVELRTPRFFDDHAEVALGLGVAPRVDREGRLRTTAGSTPRVEARLMDVRLTGRVYPLGRGRLNPYVGGGYGYYRLRSTSRGRGERTGCPPGFGFGVDCFEIVEKDETLASGYNPHAVAGIEIELRRREDEELTGDPRRLFLLVEYRHEFERDQDLDGGLILGGIGASW